MSTGLVTVFGGSGFIGKHVVRALIKQGYRVRVAMRRPHIGQDLKVIGNVGHIQIVQANLRFEDSVIRAVEGADAVINLVALLYESGSQSFDKLHIDGAETVAKAASAASITNFVQVSAIGADVKAKSEYSRTKGEGEARVKAHVPTADIIRPSIVFGSEDKFFNRFAALAGVSLALPLIGGGETKFQPVYVGDVATAIAKVVRQGTTGTTYELGGPRTYSYKELMQFILTTIDRKRLLLPIPWAGANMLGFMGEISGALPFVSPFLTRDQVVSLQKDNIVSETTQSLSDLGIIPETIEAIVPAYLERFRKYGQFYEKRT